MAVMDPLDLLAEATNALVRSVDGLDADALGAPSALPGWSRGHVVAHLALNAEGLTRALVGVVEGSDVPQYDSSAARAADIEELAGAPEDELRARFLASCTRLAKATAALQEGHLDATVRRTASGRRTFGARSVPGRRLVEVAVHHVDLDVGHRRTDWPVQTAGALVDSLVPDLGALGPLTLQGLDAERTWRLGGTDGPIVQGTTADLAWWLTGRGADGLVTDSPPLPDVPAR